MIHLFYRPPSETLRHVPDMSRRGPAASADHSSSAVHDLFHHTDKLFWRHIIVNRSILLFGKSGVGLYDHGKGGMADNFLKNGQHLLRSQTAVDAKRIHAKSFQHSHGGTHVRAGQKSSFLIKDHRGKYR